MPIFFVPKSSKKHSLYPPEDIHLASYILLFNTDCLFSGPAAQLPPKDPISWMLNFSLSCSFILVATCPPEDSWYWVKRRSILKTLNVWKCFFEFHLHSWRIVCESRESEVGNNFQLELWQHSSRDLASEAAVEKCSAIPISLLLVICGFPP